ncbi:uncharacterized protein LOC123550060 [Mercenaria mercenaria]|uniref:uncharacterized protein LOC123550060 n=1 Tax=Mercenaria mercenaria TaxID=6596 RepID=UPI00234E9455|nr:uncharacterized protein LOC123550060 [Mercenaria mercenaria]
MDSFRGKSKGRGSEVGNKPYKETYGSVSSSNLPGLPYSKCVEHDSLPQELFCTGHENMICVMCRRLYHGKCKKVVPITDVCVDFSKSNAIGSCEKQIRKLIRQCYAVAKERDWDMNDLGHKRSDILSTVMHMKKRIFERVEKLISAVTKDLDRLYEIEIKEMNKHSLSLREMASALEEKIARIEASKKDQSELSLFIAVQTAIEKHKKMSSALGHIHDEAHKVVLKFETSDAVENAMKSLNSIGGIVLNTMEYKVIPRPQQMSKPTLTIEAKEPEEYKIRKHVADRKAFEVGEMNIRDREDLETCWITGMAVLKDSTLIIADNNNNRIKLLRPNHEILNSFKLSTPPFDVALLNQREAVYTLPDMKQIQVINIVGKSDVKHGSVLTLDFDCNGICVLHENIVVTSIAEKCVRLIDLRGDVIWTAATDDRGDMLFEWPWYVETNTEGNKIYVSDRRKNTITTLDSNGGVLNVRDIQGKGPRGIALDDTGNMYMCHYMTDEIEIVSTDNPRDRRVFLTKSDGVKHPQSLCYDEEKGQLFLSANNCDYVSIFQIK